VGAGFVANNRLDYKWTLGENTLAYLARYSARKKRMCEALLSVANVISNLRP
jgi:hypothetical protein